MSQLRVKNHDLLWLYGISALFILLNAIMMFFEVFWLPVIPFFLLLTYYLFVSLDKVLWIIIIGTPLSVNYKFEESGLAISLPTEPLIICVLGLFILKTLKEGGFSRKLVLHPVSITIVIYLLWMLITSVTSSMPLVSFKFLVSRCWFIVAFYYFGYFLFTQEKNILRFFWAYCLPFTSVIAYTLVMHSQYGFDQETANWVMSPFYNDHTAYGAMLCFFIPALFSMIVMPNRPLFAKAMALLFLLIFLGALLLSYSRAAWVSMMGGIGFAILLYFRVNFKLVITGALLGAVVLYGAREQLLVKLEKNRQDSSTDFGEHVKSISNISSDASNLERLNRWQSAFRMFRERPHTGWGPGTYAFKYAPFQFSYDKTIISTNAGDKGNAHSEYIGPLAETGWPGSLSFIAVVLSVFITGISLYKRTEDRNHRAILLALLTGLFTYCMHGVLNNFLDTDKASVPFWAFFAAIVAMDMRSRQNGTRIAGNPPS